MMKSSQPIAAACGISPAHLSRSFRQGMGTTFSAYVTGVRLREGERFQILAPADQWQTTRLVDGDFALVSCVVAPAFHEEDCLLPPKPLDNEIYG